MTWGHQTTKAQAAGSGVAHLVLLAGAVCSVLIAGTEDVWAIAVFLAAAGLALLIIRPVVRPAALPLFLIATFASLSLLAFLPQDCFSIPEWRRVLAELAAIPLADSVNPQPWLGWFWWWLLAGTCLLGVALLAGPLDTKALAHVLHASAFFVAVYAAISIFAMQSGWRYPFHGGAVFGFLPNRNHTATLLVVGAVISFGLMQWRLARGDKGAAAFAALCGAPSLAALLFFSTSRAGVVFLAVGLAVWATGAARSAAMRRRIFAAVAVLVVFAGVLFVVGGSIVRDRLATLWSEAVSVQMDDADKDVDFRQPIFRDAARMIADQPLSGSGLGQFRYVFPQYRVDSARAANVLHPESDWLMVAAETGIPSALVLAALLLWYGVACWKSRAVSGGMLRWTAASAVIAAALHGAIDVPWHRVSLGWFLLTIAASSVPSSGVAACAPGLLRTVFVAAGIAFIAAAGWIGHEKTSGRSPAPYQWPEISKKLQRLGEELRYEEAELVARAAVRRFPLTYESHYWLAGHLRAFADTGPDISAAVQAGRAVEPVLANVPAEQAVILQSVNADAAMEAWLLAAERAAAIATREDQEVLQRAGNYVDQAVAAFKGDARRQLELVRRLAYRPVLAAHWVTRAEQEAVAEFVPTITDVAKFLDALPSDLRGQVLLRWISLPDSARALDYMEQREVASPKGEFWPVLARHYAARGDLQSAVKRVALSCDIPLGELREGAPGLRGRIAGLLAQGNTVAARRMAAEAVWAQSPQKDHLAGALAYFASQNDWEMAWKAASRLVTATKNRQ